MPFTQVLRSRAQFTIPLLRQSIRAHTPALTTRARCFVTTLPRFQELSDTTNPINEDSTQNEGSLLPQRTRSIVRRTGPWPLQQAVESVARGVEVLRRTTGPPIRRVDRPPFPELGNFPRSSTERPFTINVYDQGFAIVRISRLFECIRDPTLTVSAAVVIQKISIKPADRGLTSETIILNPNDIDEERGFIRQSPDSAQTPIMEKLGITNIEGDNSRYIIKNLRKAGLGVANDLAFMVELKSDELQRAEVFFTRRVVDNMEAVRKTPMSEFVVFEWEGGIFQSIPWLRALERVISQHKFLVLTMRRAVGFLNPEEMSKLLSWDPTQYRSLISTAKRAERRTLKILETSLGKPTVSAIINGEEVEITLETALEDLIAGIEVMIEKTESLLEMYQGVGVDKDLVNIRRMQRYDKRITRNIESILNTPLGQGVEVVNMYGKRVNSHDDAVFVVAHQIARNLGAVYKILSDMGHRPPIQSLPLDGEQATRESRLGEPPRKAMKVHRTYNGLSVRRTYGRGGLGASSIREYSTGAVRRPQEGRERAGFWKQRESTKGPQGGAGARSVLKRKRIETPKPVQPKLEPGHSVKDKMIEKEKERLKAMEGLVYSLLTKDQEQGGSASVQKVVEGDTHMNIESWEDGGEIGGLTDESGVEPLRMGDMCELRMGGSSTLGIFLRPSLFGEPTSDFLLMTGEISMAQAPRINFAVPSFAPEETIIKLVNHYDKIFKASGLAPSERSQIVLPRSMMSSVLEKVRDFTKESARLYSAKRAQFDNLYERIALKDEPTTITLFEAAEEIFGKKFGDKELYATHLALMGDGARYMADKAVHRATSTFTVRSKADVAMIEFVTQHVRKSTSKEDIIKKQRNAARNVDQMEPIDNFIKKAKFLIDLSRRYKKGDLKEESLVERVGVQEIVWDKNDMFFINYVKASVMKYGAQSTPMEGLVPAILRATNRYTDMLDAVVGYQFLAEIGAWSPWENLALRQQNVTFPGYGTSKVTDEDEEMVTRIDTPGAVEEMNLKDCLKDIRKDWGQLEVYCIDDASAHEIDDGISLERVSETENWVHVHIANPTAFLPQRHWLSDVAFRRKQTIYLPERTYPMLPTSLTNLIGMGPNRGVMTISAKINKAGEILDYNVQAGFVRDVKRFTYDAISEVLGEPKKELHTYQIGKFPEPTYNKNPKVEFSEKQVEDFKTLSGIALACRERRVRDNFIECHTPTYEVDVYGLNSSIHPSNSEEPFLYRGHPSIRLTVDRDNNPGLSNFMVSEIMQLANSVVAKFCKEKDIAVPYRVMEYDYQRGDLIKHFLNEVAPTRNKQGRLDYEVGLRYIMFLGQTSLSATPKPHRLMGLEDGYVRATSPLRRYSDMIAHWQIQAHLLGKSPRTHKQLSGIIPEMDRGERLAQFTAKESKRFWGTVAVGRMLETDKTKLPNMMELLVMEKQRYPSQSVGLVLDLAMAGKVKFGSKAEEMSVEVGDIVKVSPDIAKSGEKFVWYNFQGLLKKAGRIMDLGKVA